MVFRLPGSRYHPGVPGGAGTVSCHGLLIWVINLSGFGSGFFMIMVAIDWSYFKLTKGAAPDNIETRTLSEYFVSPRNYRSREWGIK